MKDITTKLIPLLKEGYCAPQIAQLAKKIKQPASTIHYNIKKLEKEGKIRRYRAVFNHNKIGQGMTVFVLINLSPDEYGNPERIANDLSKHPEIESINIITGDWELALKIRVKDQEEYYSFVKNVISRKGIIKISSLITLKEVKSEFINL
ncbi:MAG: Lrp/AsnC family transcriptional regulator [Nanoarchaeota archaeon]